MSTNTSIQRYGSTRKTIYGNATRTAFNGVQSFVTTMPYAELLRSCSLDLIPEHLKSVYKNIQRVATPTRRNGFEDYCHKHLTHSTSIGGVIPAVMIGCMHTVELQLSDNPRMNDTLTIQPDFSFIIDGVARLSTGGEIIGGYDNFLIKKKHDTNARLARRTEIKDELALLEIPVVYIFQSDKTPLTEDDFAQIFADVNGQQQPMRLNQLMKLQRTDPVTSLATRLGNLPVILSHGGMSLEGERVTEKSEHVLTLNSLTRFVLGAIGGFKMQTKLKGVRELSNGAILGEKHVKQFESDIKLFLDTWVNEQGDQFSYNKNGFQLVTTLIQALGLVFHQVWQDCNSMTKSARSHQIYSAAETLGRLNYSRTASHWQECDFMLLGEDGQYKVIAGGGSSTRKYFAKHLCKKIGITYRLVG